MNNKSYISNLLNTTSNTVKEIKDTIISKGFIHLLFSNAFISFLGFIVQLFIAYILLPEDIGRIKFLQVFVLTGGIVSGLGFNTAIQKLCSEKRADGEKIFLLKKGIKYSLIASLIVYLVVLFLSNLNLFSNDPIINRIIPVYSIVLLPQTIYMLLMSYMEARKMVKPLSSIQALTKIISIILIIIPTYYFLFIGYVYGYVAGLIITAVSFYIYIRRTFQNVNQIKVENPFSLEWGYAKYSLLINILNVINLNIDIFLINYLIPNRETIGYYSFAATLLVSLYLITTTIQQITTPYFSEKGTTLGEWNRIFKKYNHMQNLFAAVTAVISILIGPILITLIFSGKYNNSIPFFIMLTLGWFARNLYTLKIVAMFGAGEVKINFYAFFVGTIIGIILTYFLINLYGINGAGYANVAVGLVTFIVVSIYFKNYRAKKVKD